MVLFNVFFFRYQLYGTLQGNRPDWKGAAGGEFAKEMYDSFVDNVRTNYVRRAAKERPGEESTSMELSFFL